MLHKNHLTNKFKLALEVHGNNQVYWICLTVVGVN